MNITDKIRQEIEDLRDQLLSLDEAIWGSVEHRDPEALKEFIPRKEEINQKIVAFQTATSALLESFEKLAPMGMPSVQVEPDDEGETVGPLERHFAFLKPKGLIVDGQRMEPAKSWRKLWHLFLQDFHNRFPEQFKKNLVDTPCIAGVREVNERLYEPFECGGRWFESNLSSDSIRERMIRILDNSGISRDRVKVILRGKPDIKDTIFDKTKNPENQELGAK